MKAILVTDMPKSCKECCFCGFGGANLEQYVCSLTGEHSENPHLIGCPLRPLPKKEEKPIKGEDDYNDFCIGYTRGWNECLEDILGETE